MCYHPNPQLMAMDDCYFQGGSSLHPKDVSDAIWKWWKAISCFLPATEIVKLYVLSPQLMAMDDCSFQVIIKSLATFWWYGQQWK
jgi:hypothetical protein